MYTEMYTEMNIELNIELFNLTLPRHRATNGAVEIRR